jgi:hypothetical protein
MAPYHHPQLPPPSSQRTPLRNDGKAVASLVLGLLSLACLGFFAGVPAIVLGALARRDIDRSQGMIGGRGLAAGGIVAGLFGTGISLVASVFVLASALEMAKPHAPSEAPVRVPVAAGARSYGALDVVDIDDGRPLRVQLADVVAAAGKSGRLVILQTYVRASPECAEVAASLPDARMQRALSDVVLVRVDVDDFENELREMRVETETVPWFYKLDKTSRPTDAISADEWDDNIPENMAPVLASFARGTLGMRRTPAPLGTAL